MINSVNDLGHLFSSAVEESDSLFNTFEPWDVPERPDWMIDFARSHHIELPKEAHEFQTGFLMSTDFITVNLAGNQTGKSIASLIECIMQATGEIPVALRTPKGETTKVKRNMTDEKARRMNIRRWGRRDMETGEIIDHNEEATPDGTWDCGFVIGAGIYPEIKMPKGPAQIWICTFKQAKQDYWWPELKRWWPPEMLNRNKGVDGFAEGTDSVYSHNGSVVVLKSYEQGYERVEAMKVHHILLDEEPPDRRFYTGCLTHAIYISMQFTPIRGISWSKHDIIDQKDENKNISVFHATQLDCPYQVKEVVMASASLMKSWELESKVFGFYSAQVGKPYFDRSKINAWTRNFVDTGTLYTVKITKPWNDPFEIPRLPVVASEWTGEQMQDTWLIFEEPEEDKDYYAVVDTAEGIEDENINMRADMNCCIIRKKKEEGDLYDPVVAVLHNQMKTVPFAAEVLAGCRWYGNCVLFPEGTGDTGSVFVNCVLGYPFMGKMTVVQDATRKTVDKIGFQNRHTHRREAYSLVDTFINVYEKDPKLPIKALLHQMSECVIGKNGRPDHPAGKHDDVLMCFAMSEWFREYCEDQIRSNWHYVPKKQETYLDKRKKPQETRPLIGTRRGLDTRRKYSVSGVRT